MQATICPMSISFRKLCQASLGNFLCTLDRRFEGKYSRDSISWVYYQSCIYFWSMSLVLFLVHVISIAIMFILVYSLQLLRVIVLVSMQSKVSISSHIHYVFYLHQKDEEQKYAKKILKAARYLKQLFNPRAILECRSLKLFRSLRSFGYVCIVIFWRKFFSHIILIYY